MEHEEEARSASSSYPTASTVDGMGHAQLRHGLAGLGSTPLRWIGKKLGEWIGEGGTEGVELSATDKGREGRQRIREDDDDNQCSLWVCSRRERKERGDERKKKARGILVHKI